MRPTIPLASDHVVSTHWLFAASKSRYATASGVAATRRAKQSAIESLSPMGMPLGSGMTLLEGTSGRVHGVQLVLVGRFRGSRHPAAEAHRVTQARIRLRPQEFD